jgi:hypothetical protein
MALGLFADTNIAAGSTFAGGTWSPDLPLTNMVADGFLAKPARCIAPLTLAKTQFEVTLPWAQRVTLVALLFHTLTRSARYRITVAGATGDLSAPVYQSAWLQVTPRISRSRDLPWGAPNWWTGQPLAADMDLYPRNTWIRLPAPTLTKKIRIELDDSQNTAGWLDVGGLWVVSGWSPPFNYDRGRELAVTPRSLIDEAPSGREFSEERRARRQLSVTWSRLFDVDANRLIDAAARAGTTKTVLFIPDLDNPASLVREAFPAKFAPPPAPKFTFDGLNTASATLKEVIA